jgi:hypothetical protein
MLKPGTRFKTLSAITVVLLLVFVFTTCDSQDEEKENGQTPTLYTVDFDSNGGSPVASQTVSRGDFLGRPAIPTHSNSNNFFMGWFRLELGEYIPWDFRINSVNRSFTLYALWFDSSAVAISIIFDSNGGIAVQDTIQNIRINENYDLADYVTTRENYEFDGWYNYNYGSVQGVVISLNDIWNRLASRLRNGEELDPLIEITLEAMWRRIIIVGEGGSFQPAGPNDIVSRFMLDREGGIDPTQNATWNLGESVLMGQLDAPGPASSFSGFGWQENGNIRVLDNREKQISDLIDEDGIFEFYLHSTRDFDGGNVDRQRIEIKGGTHTAQSRRDFDIKAFEDSVMTYYWKMYIPHDVMHSELSGFFHIFQIKATVGQESGAPNCTFTLTSDQLLFRATRLGATMETTQVIASAPRNRVTGRWLAAEVSIHFRDNGYIYGKLTDLTDNTVIMEEGRGFDTWRRPEERVGGVWRETNLDSPSTQLKRPKWGLYRSLNAQTREAAIMWADCVIIKRHKESYVFPDGYNPMDAGPVPNRDFSETWAHDYVTRGASGNWRTVTKSSISHRDLIAVHFNKGNQTRYDWPRGLMESGERMPGWTAIDLGETRKINEIMLNFEGGNDPQRLHSMYIAVTNDTEAWDALITNTSGAAVTGLNSNVTTFDPLGIHTTSERYYTGPNPYLFADRWTKFVAIPELSFSNSNPKGILTNFGTLNTFNRNRSMEGMIPGVLQVEGRYVILYCDINPYPRLLGAPNPPVLANAETIKFAEFLIRYDPAKDPAIVDDTPID